MRLIKWLFGGSRADRLLLAATVVAGVRMMLISAVFIGFDLDTWGWFKPAEVWSGLAYAVLEGMALAYVSSLWVRLRPAQPLEWAYWSVLALGQLVLFGSIIGVTGLAATAVRTGTGIDEMLTNGGAVAWSMFVTALNPLMVILIGISRAIDPQEQGGKDKDNYYPKHNNGRISVAEKARFWAGYYHEATPDEFSRLFEDETGLGLTVEEAEAALAEARAVGRNGRGRK